MAIKVNNDVVIDNSKNITAAEVKATKLETENILYPVADGASGQVLVTDGAGTLSFGNASPALTAGDGIDISTTNDVTTIAVDLASNGNTGNGLDFSGNKLEVNKATATSLGTVEVPTSGNLTVDADGKISVGIASTSGLGVVQVGAGLAIDNNGVLSTDLDALSFVGGVDLTAASVPGTTPSVGATYVNTADGTISAEWKAVISGISSDIPVAAGDLVAHKGSGDYVYIATGGIPGGGGGGGASVEVGPTAPASPTEGDLWWNTKDGDNTLYVYYNDGLTSQWVVSVPVSAGIEEAPLDTTQYARIDGGWQAVNTAGSGLDQNAADALYVKLAGSNMTGDLTLGTDKITLATDGSAEFAGGIIGNLSLSETAIGGTFYTNSDSDSYPCVMAQNYNDDGAVFLGRDSIGDIKIQFGANGSATFSGGATEISGTGSIGVRNYYNVVTDDLFACYAGRNYSGTTTSRIFADGAASFASGGVSVEKTGVTQIDTGDDISKGGAAITYSGSAGTRYLRINGDGTVGIGGTLAGGLFEPNIALYSEGNGTFKGLQTTAGVTIDCFNGSDKAFQISREADINVTIDARGNATFAGNVTAGDYPTPRAHFAASEFFANANPKTATRTNSGVAMVEDGANNGSLFLRNTAGDPNIVLSGSDGSATFAGRVDVGNLGSEAYGLTVSNGSASRAAIYSQNDTAGGYVWQGHNGSTETSNIGADGSATFSGTVSSAGSFAIQLEADDDTKYTSTTDSEGVETRVYNGEVLDVKDRLQNVLARMDAIEANEITDDATDSALLTLIANLTTRLDERDATIAALTARVETLES